MSSISLLQWRKAYMLEFLDGNTVKDCFTFSVPPESEEFQFSQRIVETKTFGGSVFEDYGNDSYKITLSGSTVNEDKKFIYKGKKVPQYLTGTKEIFELQKIIKNWADDTYSGFFRNPSSKNKIGHNKRVMLYDLSKMSVVQVAAGTASRNYWQVFILDLKIKRDKSKPNTYNYTLEMIGIEGTRKGKGGLSSGFAKAVDGIQKGIDSLQVFMDITVASTEGLSQIAKCLADVKKAWNTLKARHKEGVDLSLIMLEIGSGIDSVNRVIGGDSNDFYNATKNLLSACSTFVGLFKDNTTPKTGKTESTSLFKVSFSTNGGSTIKTQTVEYCSTATKPANPTKDKYAFVCWCTDSECTTEYMFHTEVTADITLYAKWELAIATVTYVSGHGTPVLPQEVAVGSATVKPTSPIREGYLFDVWCTNHELLIEFDFSTPVTGNITLYARWEKVYSINFNSSGGSAVETQVKRLNELVIYPKTPTKENYSFAYWCIDEALQNVYDFATPVTTDMTLYAFFVHVSSTVTFNSLGGSSVPSQRVVLGGYATEPATPTKEGYTLEYWADSALLNNEFIFETVPVNENITLYAKWNALQLAVVFDSVGGSVVETQMVDYSKKAIFPDIPTKDGYTFEMWCTKHEVLDENNEPTGEYEYIEFDFSTAILEDVTLYAQWFGA